MAWPTWLLRLVRWARRDLPEPPRPPTATPPPCIADVFEVALTSRGHRWIRSVDMGHGRLSGHLVTDDGISVPVTISDLELLQNRGPAMLVDLLVTKVRNSELEIERQRSARAAAQP